VSQHGDLSLSFDKGILCLTGCQMKNLRHAERSVCQNEVNLSASVSGVTKRRLHVNRDEGNIYRQ